MWKGEKGQCNGHEPKIISHITMDILKYHHFLQRCKNHSNSKCNFQINEAPNIFCCMLVMETMFESGALFLLGLATIGLFGLGTKVICTSNYIPNLLQTIPQCTHYKTKNW